MLQPRNKAKNIPSPEDILGAKSIPSPDEVLGADSKKKESSELVSTTTNPNGDSAQPSGSSATQKSNPFDSVDAFGGKTPTEAIVSQQNNQETVTQDGLDGIRASMQKLHRNEVAMPNLALKAKLNDYRQAIQLDDSHKAEAEKELNAVKNEEGFLNKTKSILNQTKNFFKSGGFFGQKDNPLELQVKQAEKEFTEKGIKPTKEQLSKRADEIFVEQKLDNVKQQKINDFLSSIDDDTKLQLEADAQTRYNTLSSKTKELTDRIALNSNYGNHIADELDKTDLTPDDRKMLEEELLNVSKEIDKDQNKYLHDASEIGSTAEELDAFKRNYGKIDNFTQRAITSIGNAGIDLMQGLNYVQTGGGNLPVPGAEALNYKLNEAKSGIEAYKEKFRPDNKELTAENWGTYSTDMLGDMAGLMLEMSTGSAMGLPMVGVGGAGRKYSEMKQEQQKTGKEFTPAQMAIAPLLSGTAEAALFALPVGKALEGTKRVWMSLGENEFKQAVNKASKSLGERIIDGVGEQGKHIITADVQMSLNNIVQNAINKDILGKEDVGYFDNAWKVLTDATLLTGMIHGAGTLPQVAIEGVKMFTPAEKVKTLDVNGNKLIAIEKQLRDPNLNETTRQALESQKEQLTKESSEIVGGTIDKLSKMDESEVKNVLSDIKKTEQIKKSADEVKSDKSKSDKDKKIVLQALKEDYVATKDKIQTKLNEEPAEKSKQEAQPQAEEQKESIEVENNENNSIDLPNESAETKIPDGSPQEELRISDESNRRIYEISKRFKIGTGKAEAEGGTGEKLRIQDVKDVEAKEAVSYAKENNLWYKNINELGENFSKGNEANVVVNPQEGYVYKSNNLMNKQTISKLFDNVKIHNELFPEAKYEFVGFTGLEGNGERTPYVEPIFRQRLIHDSELATPAEIKSYMESLGFKQKEAFRFSNGEIEAWDLRPRNVLKDPAGNIYVIDGEFIRLKPESNEAKTPRDIVADENIRTGTEINRERGDAERNDTVDKDIQAASDTGTSEKAPEIDFVDKFKAEQKLNEIINSDLKENDLNPIDDYKNTLLTIDISYDEPTPNRINRIAKTLNIELPKEAGGKFLRTLSLSGNVEYKDVHKWLDNAKEIANEKLQKANEIASKHIKEPAEVKENKPEVENKEKKVSEASRKLADEVRKLKISRPDAFQSHTPASLAWDLGVEAVAKTIEATGDIVQAVSDGLEAIKSTEWYKSLSEDKKAQAEASFKDSFKQYKEPEVVAEVDGNKYTSLKKAVYDSEREQQGREVVNTTNPKSPKEVRSEVESKFKSGEITETEIRDIASALASRQDIATKLTGEEIEYALLHDKVTLQKEGRQIDLGLEKAQAENNQEAIDDLIFKKAQNEIKSDVNYMASKTTGSEASRIMHAKKAGLDEDYSYQAVMDRINSISEKASPEMKEKIKGLTNQITDLQTKIDEYQSKFDEFEKENAKLEKEKSDLEEVLSKGSAEDKLERLKKLKDKTNYKKADIERRKKQKIDEIRAKYRKISGTLNAGINPKFLELAPDISALARLYIQEGVVTLEELLGKIMIDLDIPELNERTVRDLFSGYGKSVKLNDNPEAVALSELKSKARAISGLEDAKEGIAPAKSGLKHREPTEEVKAIRREITEEMRRQGINLKAEKSPEDVWKTALESYKKRLKNRIEYLETIKKNEDVERFIREKQRVKLKLDQEARDLKKQQQLLKNQVDDMVKRADFETWSNFRKGLNYANRFSRGVLISSPVTLVKIIGAATWRATYKPLLAVSTYGATKLAPSASKIEGIHTVKDLGEHLATYYSELFSKKNYKEFKETFKHHKTTEDITLGKYRGEDIIPKVKVKGVKTALQASFFWSLRVLDKNGALHGSLKNFVSRPEYEAYRKTILKNLIKEGVDPETFNQPTLHAVADQLAFQKGLMARFMQDNIPASTQKMVEGYLEGKGRHTEKELLNIAFPIVKIGSNYVTESLEKLPLVGLTMNAKPLYKLMFDKGNMTPQQKSNVLRALSYQGVGLASYMIGMYCYQSISPFYGTNAKKYAQKNGRDNSDEDEDLGFLNHTFTHSPEAVMMKAGASHMWLWDKYDEEHHDEKSMVTFMGEMFQDELQNVPAVVSQSPYISGSESVIAPILTPGHDVGKAEANFLRARIPFMDMLKDYSQGKVPIVNRVSHGLGEKIGEKIGLKPETVKPYEVGIYPKGFINNIAIGIPGWRDKVLNEMYEEKYGVQSKIKDVDQKIEELQHKGEKDVKKITFQAEHAKD